MFCCCMKHNPRRGSLIQELHKRQDPKQQRKINKKFCKTILTDKEQKKRITIQNLKMEQLKNSCNNFKHDNTKKKIDCLFAQAFEIGKYCEGNNSLVELRLSLGDRIED